MNDIETVPTKKLFLIFHVADGKHAVNAKCMNEWMNEWKMIYA